MRIWVLAALILILGASTNDGASAQTRSKPAAQPAGAPFSHESEREKVNENLVMLLGGTLGGPWIQMAQEISTVVDDGDNLRVMPLAGGGGKSNLRDVLLLRGVDVGITRLDVVNEAKALGEFGPNLDRRIAYVAPLAVDMLQLVVRPEIGSLNDLNGKKVNILPKGSIIPSILKKLGVEIVEVNLTIPDGLEQMRTGAIYGNGCVCSVPIPAYRTLSPELGFKLLDIPYIEAIEESYLPASLSNDTYPNLIGKESKVQTVGSHLLLLTYNWTPGTDRYRKLEKFVDAFFTKFDKLRQPPRHPSWREVNIGATIRGWPRFAAAQQWLDRKEAEVRGARVVDPTLARAQAARAAGGDVAEQERLFKEFMEWSRKRPK